VWAAPTTLIFEEVMNLSVFMLCERALGLVDGTALNELDAAQRALLEELNYEGLQNKHAQKEALACVRHFAGIRDGLLETYPWVFARKTAELAELAEPIKGWRFSYALPADCVRLLQLIWRRRTIALWEETGGSISSVKAVGCEYRPVTARYTAKIIDTERWPALFAEALCLKLAASIAVAVNKDFGGISMLLQQHAGVIAEAYRVGILDEGGQIEEDLYRWDRYSNDLSREYLGSRRHELC
jgi:hypothetical protein